MKKFVKKVLGDPEAKTLKRLKKRVKDINALSDSYNKLSDSALRKKTEELKKTLETKGQTLDTILPEAFADCSRNCLASNSAKTLRCSAYWWNGFA
jgi:preprotein translocase subunit SecA